MPRKRCCKRRKLRYPWLWALAVPLALLQLYAFWENWESVVYGLSLPVILMWMGCCCAGGDCGPCCRDRGCLSETVEYRIVGCVACGSGFDYTCSTTCPILPTVWTTINAGVAEPQCSWEGDPPDPCATGQASFNTITGATIRFAKKKYNCSGGSSPYPLCVLTGIATGDSTTSGFGGGPWIAIWEKVITGPYPTDCEGIHSLTFVCASADVPCDFSGTTFEVNFVFNGACDITATFNPWTDTVGWEIESTCLTIDGDTDTLNNASTFTTQQWSKTNVGVPGTLNVDVSLYWDSVACAYKMTLTPSGAATTCRLLNGLPQTVTGTTVDCDPFELLFSGFVIEDDPGAGPCPCGDPHSFNVRIRE